tara:strand:+ start:871 stop:1248 length:378 start_codon:yes stop_codon:yes gene_type:complete
MKKLLAIIVLGLLWSDIVFAHHDGFIQHSWAKPTFIIGFLALAYLGWFYNDLEKYNKGEKKSLDFLGGLAYLSGPFLLAVICFIILIICLIIIWNLFFYPYIAIFLVIVFGGGWIVLKISEKKKW